MLDSHPPVQLFGPAHLTALALVVTLGAGLSAVLRKRESEAIERGIRGALVALLLAALTLHWAWVADNRELTVWEFVPLHLCDLSLYLAVYALLAKSRRAAELLYFWTCSGTALAMVLPAIDRGFPSFRFLIYFMHHGGIVVAAVVLIYGLRLYPDRRAPRRAFGYTLIYMSAVGVFDWITGRNFLYLRHKPAEQTLLDYFGPWPVYIIVSLAIGFGIFQLLGLPFRHREPE